MDDYPTDEELEKIKNWPYTDFLGLAEYIVNLWHYGDPWVKLTGKKVKTLRLATGGWSGNESIVSALHENTMFQMMCWEKSERGGLYIYKIKPIKS